MSKLISRLGTMAAGWRTRSEPEAISDWSPLFCKMMAINLARTTVKRSRWR
jgi:hypothetical protein